MLLHDETRQSAQVPQLQPAAASTRLSIAAALAAGLAPAPLVHQPRLPRRRRQPDLRRHRQELALLHGVYGFTQQSLTPGPSRSAQPSSACPATRSFSPSASASSAWRTTAPSCTSRSPLDLLTCWLVAALAGRLFGRRAALPPCGSPRSAPLPPTTSPAPHRDPRAHLSRWPSTPSSRWQSSWKREAIALQPLALAHRRRPRLLHPAPPGAGPARRRHPPRDALGSARRRLNASAKLIRTAAAPVLADRPSCVLLPLVPWTIRNWHTFHVFQPLAPRYATDPGEAVPHGFHRWFRTWGIDSPPPTNVYWNYDGSPIDSSHIRTRAFASGCPRLRHPARIPTPLRPHRALLDDYNQTTDATPPSTPASTRSPASASTPTPPLLRRPSRRPPAQHGPPPAHRNVRRPRRMVEVTASIPARPSSAQPTPRSISPTSH